MAKHSHESAEPVVIWDLVDEFLVECPKCAACASVRPLRERRGARLACAACGASEIKEADTTGPEVFDHAATNDATDPFFLLPLWLRTDCGQHVLSAYNADHLTFLERHLGGADLRPPPERYARQNHLHEARMPKWMKRARNRKRSFLPSRHSPRGWHRRPRGDAVHFLTETWWTGPLLWAVLYSADYALTLAGARLYVGGAQRYFDFGEYELTPEYQADIRAQRLVSPTFVIWLLGVSLTLCMVHYLAVPGGAGWLYSFFLGLVVLPRAGRPRGSRRVDAPRTYSWSSWMPQVQSLASMPWVLRPPAPKPERITCSVSPSTKPARLAVLIAVTCPFFRQRPRWFFLLRSCRR